MTYKDIAQAILMIQRQLCNCPFQGDQILVIAECLRILDSLVYQINQHNLNNQPAHDGQTTSEEG